MADKTVKVYPSSTLAPTEYVPGVGENGAELPEDEANALLEAGLVVKNKPSKSAEFAEKMAAARAAKKKSKSTEPAPPADKPEEQP